MIYLRPMSDEERESWLEDQREGYIISRIGTGETPEEARRVAGEQYSLLFPDGRPAPGHLLSRVMEDDTPVGWLWIGPRTPERPDAFWVWDVVIDEPYRGGGRGRAAMVLAEEQARAAGASELGLNVFGDNTAARRLYESLGYDATAIQMRKGLAPES